MGILVAPLPVDIEKWRHCKAQKACIAGEDFDFHSYERCCAFSKKVATLGFRRSIPVLDLLMEADMDWKRYLVDGCHLHRRGHDLVFQSLLRLINHNYPYWDRAKILGDVPAFDPLRPGPVVEKSGIPEG